MTNTVLITRRSILTGASMSVAMLGFTRFTAAAMELYGSKSRPLVIFTPQKRYPAFLRQLRYLSGRGNRIRERDIVVILVVGDRVSSQYGAKPAMTASELRKVFDVTKDAYSMVLVGKDTDVKRRYDAPITAGQLFAQIDALPQRQRELRSKSDS